MSLPLEFVLVYTVKRVIASIGTQALVLTRSYLTFLNFTILTWQWGNIWLLLEIFWGFKISSVPPVAHKGHLEMRASVVLVLTAVQCLMCTRFFPSWWDAAPESIPVLWVRNKGDVHDAAEAEGRKCVPGNFGAKLATVRVRVGLNWKRSFTFVYFCWRGCLTNLHSVWWVFCPYTDRTPGGPCSAPWM